MNEVDEFAPQRAVKSQVKLRIAIDGPSGSGKTEGALSLATAILLARGFNTIQAIEKKILVVDTEDKSASLYADRYVFDTVILRPPYSPSRYMKAMSRALDGYEIVILDSITHEWQWCLAEVDRLKKSAKNEFTVWGTVSPLHDEFIECIKACPLDIICTMRSKQAYELQVNDKGKKVPVKLGMAPIQREGVDYEFSLVFDLDTNHKATTSKNRTTLFKGEDDSAVNLMDPAVGGSIHAWRAEGAVLVEVSKPVPTAAPPPAVPKAQRATLPGCVSVEDLAKFWMNCRNGKKTDDEVRRWVNDTWPGIESTSHIPVGDTRKLLEFSVRPTPVRLLQPGEKECREAQVALGVSEPDLYYELSLVRGDWYACRNALSANADRALQEQEAVAQTGIK